MQRQRPHFLLGIRVGVVVLAVGRTSLTPVVPATQQISRGGRG